jgi:hypothetical protein
MNKTSAKEILKIEKGFRERTDRKKEFLSNCEDALTTHLTRGHVDTLTGSEHCSC